MDERCKLELRSSYSKCMEEASFITSLINNIIEKHKAILDKVNLYTLEEVIQNQKIILDSTQLNYQVFNKLFSINVELDSFIKNCIEAPLKTILEHDDHHNVDLSIATSCEPVHINTSINNNELSCVIGHAHNPNNPLQPNQNARTSISSTSAQAEAEILLASSSINNLKHENKDSVVTMNLVEDPLNSDVKKLGSESNLDRKLGNTAMNTSQIMNLAEAGPSKSIEAIFDKYKPKDRFEKKFEHIVTEIPDLSFVRVDPVCKSSSVRDNIATIDNPNSSKHAQIGGIQQVTLQQEVAKQGPKQNCTVLEIPENDGLSNNDLCYVVYICDPSEFYITLIGNDTVMIIGEQLAEYVKARRKNNLYKPESETKQSFGKYCIAYSEEYKSWNRAQILEWKTTEPVYVNIQFVDYGEYATVPHTFLIPIPSMFCEVPKQAIRCSLSNIIPINKSKKWTREAIKHFESFCYHLDQQIEIRVVSVAKKSLGFEVDLFKEGEDVSCMESMIIAGHAKLFHATEIHREENVADNVSVDLLVGQAQGLTGSSDLNNAILEYNVQDDRKLCQFARPNGTCFMGAHCNLEHPIKKIFQSTIKIKEGLFQPSNTFMPELNEVLTVTITNFQNPSLLYGHIKHPSNLNGGIMKEMLKRMNKKQVVSSYTTFDRAPEIGELVIARNVDQRWYRATVVGICGSESALCPVLKVFMIDYGEFAKLLLSNIRKMTPEFVLHPAQGFCFGISNIKSVSDYDPQAFKKFISRYLFTSVTLTVKYAGTDFIDGIFMDAEGNDLGIELINTHFAELNTQDYHPLRSSNLLED